MVVGSLAPLFLFFIILGTSLKNVDMRDSPTPFGKMSCVDKESNTNRHNLATTGRKAPCHHKCMYIDLMYITCYRVYGTE